MTSRPQLAWRIGIVAALSVGLVDAGISYAAGAKVRGGRPVVFHVGAAVERIDPPMPVYPGGYGTYDPTAKTNKEYAPLEVRAFYISNGRRAVEVAVVDSQAYFAAYQEGPLGISDVRATAARLMTTAHVGPPVTADDILVQGSHSHSAPTLEGIWGPVPVAYLRLVHDRTVTALVRAARAARPAYLQYGLASSRNIDDVAIADDTLPGWDIDGDVDVLRAVSPASGATLATFVAVPSHPVTIDGQHRHVLGPDYFGALRDDLERLLGGTVVTGPSTLGRQEPPVQTTDFRQLAFYARVLARLTAHALASAHYITNPTIASASTMLNVPGTNAAILGLAAANLLPAGQRQQFADRTTLYPIDRQVTPPYEYGNVIVTPISALRIGRVLLLSMPGEPYPEVKQAVEGAIHGARLVIGLSKGQDDLGYFMPAWTYAFGVAEGTDHPIFSVAPWMGDQVAVADAQLASQVGFFSAGLPASLPAPRDFRQAVRPGLQALADPEVGDAGADGLFHPRLEAVFNPALYGGAPNVGGVHWSFGDGSSATTGYLRTAAGMKGRAFLTHGFRPGRIYAVVATAAGANGQPVSWTLHLTALPQLHAAVRELPLGGGRVRLVAAARGGDGHLLAAHWSLAGRRLDGRSIVIARTALRSGSLTVVDGTGSQANMPLSRS